ncbi:hypothetical protein [Dysgonomonas sp. Marseille-P4361]|uniref:hypothetical protein n=1 Tax=Dysgonomonas sp. Marseille-P4361 TaxID=2161820 RepID=UPI000D55FF76|nr:hypothetical protein [Dysgonomonas sp. Marseille-P4361]
MKTHFYLIIVLLGCIFFTYSCEDPNENSEEILEKVNITTTLGNNEGESPLYFYGPRELEFFVSSDKGDVESVQFYYKGEELVSFPIQSSKFYFAPDMSTEEATSLEMRVTIAVGKKKYNETVVYKIQYVKISEEDFELKESTIDRFVFKMTDKISDGYKFILNGEVIEDLDNITIERGFTRFSFPIESNIIIYIIPKEKEYIEGNSYPHVVLDFKDSKLGNFGVGSTKFHYIDDTRKELYVWTHSELSIFDKDLNEIKHYPMEFINKFLVSPKTGLVVVQPLHENIVTYSDKNFNKVLSTIDLNLYSGWLAVNERDQLFNGHNYQIDVYDLYTGKMMYTIDLKKPLNNYTILGDKLLVALGFEEGCENQVFQLNATSATFLYSFDKAYRYCYRHPINPNHLVLDKVEGFEIYDMESQTTISSFEGYFQCIDAINGYLLYYDKDYSYSEQMFENHVIDPKYNKVLTFEDTSQSTYGSFLQFNNYIVKSDRYTQLLPNNMINKK